MTRSNPPPEKVNIGAKYLLVPAGIAWLYICAHWVREAHLPHLAKTLATLAMALVVTWGLNALLDDDNDDGN